MKKAFTLVELIVVITIVGILSTVGFVSYNQYAADSRDANRITQLKKIGDSLQVYATTKSLPLPYNVVSLTSEGIKYAYQGDLASDELEVIDYQNGGKDPKDGTYFTYLVDSSRKVYQLMVFLEQKNPTAGLHTVYAVDLSDRTPIVYGQKYGILTNMSNTPIQNLSLNGSSFDLATSTGNYIAYISDTEKMSGTGSSLAGLFPYSSCKRLRQVGKIQSDSLNKLYKNNEAVSIYCAQDFIDVDFYTYIDNGDFEKVRYNTWYQNHLTPLATQNGVKGIQLTGPNTNTDSNSEYIYVDPKSNYILSGYARSQGSGNSNFLFGFQEYDKDFQAILANHVNAVPGTDTYLTTDVQESHTSITFADINGTMCTAWQTAPTISTNGVVAFDIDDSGGYSDLPNRNISLPHNAPSAVGFNSIVDNGTTCTANYSGNPIGKTYPSGTKIRVHLRGGTYNYVGTNGVNTSVPATWTLYSGIINGQQLYGTNINKFRPGTQFLKLFISGNYLQDASKVLQLDNLKLEIQ